MEALVALGAAFMVFVGAIGVFMVVTMWILFKKAGQPGWAILIPIYNILVLLKIAGKAWWWIFLLMIPIVNIVFLIMVYHGISRSFGKDVGFTIGLILLPIIFLPILAFGDAKYQPLLADTPQS
ncbi:MAG: DUF5684 domain-containing protein [Salinivirgaceae bacterium]